MLTSAPQGNDPLIQTRQIASQPCHSTASTYPVSHHNHEENVHSDTNNDHPRQAQSLLDAGRNAAENMQYIVNEVDDFNISLADCRHIRESRDLATQFVQHPLWPSWRVFRGRTSEDHRKVPPPPPPVTGIQLDSGAREETGSFTDVNRFVATEDRARVSGSGLLRNNR